MLNTKERCDLIAQIVNGFKRRKIGKGVAALRVGLTVEQFQNILNGDTKGIRLVTLRKVAERFK